MATVDASIPLQAKKPDALGKLSDLLQLQTQMAGVKQARAAAQQEQQTAKQRAGLAEFDWQSLNGDDGTIDMNKVATSDLQKAAGDQYPAVLQSLLSAKQQGLQAKQAIIGLNEAQRGAFGQMLGALRSDEDVAKDTPEGRQKVGQAVGQFAQMFGQEVEPVIKAYAPILAKAPPGKLGQIIQNIQMQAMSAADQVTKQTPQYQQVNVGSTLERQQTNPLAPGGVDIPQSRALGIGPGEQEVETTDQLGNKYIITRDKAGNIVRTRPLDGGGGGTGGTGGTGGGPARFGPGERQSIEQQAEANFQDINATRIAANLAPQQLDQIDKAIDISKQVNTGGGGAFASKRAAWESALAAFIPGLESAADDATKLQLLDKYAERIAADSARVLGANATTDAARESITRQNANIGYTPKAIQDVLQYAKAQTMAMASKGDALENWLKKEGNGITKQHEFQAAWRQAYDPLIYQLEAATPEERRKMVEKLSKPQAAELARKRAALRELGAIK